MKRIYLDHASAMPVDPRVLAFAEAYLKGDFGNSSSQHSAGASASKAVENARSKVAELINAEKETCIVFTSGATEANNLAIKGTALRNQGKGKKLIASAVEHISVINPMKELQKSGFELTLAPVDSTGVVDLEKLDASLSKETTVTSIMYANNEVGTIQPIAEIGKIARAKGIPFHTDAVQAGGTLDMNVDRLNVDLMSLSAHKFYGPKGVGILYQRQGTRLLPTQTGGGHERGRRAGTENVPYIVGLATALKLAVEHREHQNARIAALRDRLVKGLLATVPDSYLTGHPTERLPNSASLVFQGVEGESLLLHLDMLGVAASSGSACTSGSAEPSHVLTSMALPAGLCHGSLRLTLGNENTEDDVNYALSVLPDIVSQLRAMSPEYEAVADKGRR